MRSRNASGVLITLIFLFMSVVKCTAHAARPDKRATTAPSARVQRLVETIRAKERAQAERILEREALVENESSKRELKALETERQVLKDVEASVSAPVETSVE